MNDQFFLFIKYVETLVRKTLTFTKIYKAEDIRELLHEQSEESNMINNLWKSLTRHVPNKQLTDHFVTQSVK